jgi:Na+/H+-dicarboxylate symporter
MWYAYPGQVTKQGTNVLGLVVFSLVFGYVLSLVRDQCAALVHVIADLECVFMRLTRIIIWFFPIVAVHKLVLITGFRRWALVRWCWVKFCG